MSCKRGSLRGSSELLLLLLLRGMLWLQCRLLLSCSYGSNDCGIVLRIAGLLLLLLLSLMSLEVLLRGQGLTPTTTTTTSRRGIAPVLLLLSWRSPSHRLRGVLPLLSVSGTGHRVLCLVLQLLQLLR